MDRKMWTPRSMRNAIAAVTGLWLPKSARERRLNDKAPAHVPNRAEIRRGLRALRKSGESYTQSPHAAVKAARRRRNRCARVARRQNRRTHA